MVYNIIRCAVEEGQRRMTRYIILLLFYYIYLRTPGYQNVTGY